MAKALARKIVTDSVFKTSTLTEADAAAWVVGTTYAVDALVMYNHRVYKSLQGSNVGKTPDATTSATWWSDQGPTNRWAMFDDKIGTVSRSTGTSMTVELDFGRCAGFGLFGVDATTLYAEVKDSGGTVIWSETTDLSRDPLIASWSDYFFKDVTTRTEVVRTGLPIYSTSTLKVTLSKPTGTVGLGNLVIGRDYFVGLSKWGAQGGMSDWSKKSTDSFGNTYLKQGNWAKTTKLDLHVLNSHVDTVYALITGMRGTPTVFIGDNRDASFDMLTVWGYVADFNITIPGPEMAACTLEVQGLI